jgi:hypothetical protein
MKEMASTAIPAFLAGALIGVGIALLLAPKSGSQLRGMFREYATNATKHAGPGPGSPGRRPRKRKNMSKAEKIS